MQYLIFCRWSLSSIAGAHKFIKAALLKAHLSVHEMGIICLSETYLDSSVPIDDENLQISGTTPVGLIILSTQKTEEF